MKTLAIFAMFTSLTMATLVHAASESVGNCSVDIVSASSVQNRFQLVRSVVGDPQFPALLRVELLKTSQGEPLVLTVEEVGNGFFATIATPEPNVYPTVPPTFSLRSMPVSQRAAGAPLLLYASYQNAHDSEIKSIELTCSLLK